MLCVCRVGRLAGAPDWTANAVQARGGSCSEVALPRPRRPPTHLPNHPPNPTKQFVDMSVLARVKKLQQIVRDAV